MTERFAHVDGALVPLSEAGVSVRDRGFRYGDGAFETLRVYGGRLFRWADHADRLERSCRALAIDHELSRAELRDRIGATLEANGLEDAAVRLTISRGVQPGRLAPAETTDPTVVITASSLPRGGQAGTPVWDGPATLALGTVRRPPAASIPADAKTLNYLPGVLARAEHPAADEVLMLDPAGWLAEGTTSNVFFVDGDVLCTPATERHPVLPGITRSVVLELAAAADVPVRTGTFGPAALEDASEVFLTNTTWEVRPVDRLDGRPLEPGPVTDLLRQRFAATVEDGWY